MRNSTKALAVGGLVGALMLGATGTAYAGTKNIAFNETLPRFQIAGWTNSQTKEISDFDGHVNVGTVGDDYSVDVEMCQSALLACSAKVRGLKDRSEANLHNRFPAGAEVRLQLRIGKGNVVQVQVQGAWRSN
ncbi:hypothetical protein HRK28_04165 [Rathayibacter sp. VKM Ac-2835]|uniref:hypothetical protein n=1 Tax=Rathayibacter sp. VKM Ac-2835 TaxID=2739043 RepID=UPI001563655B|nr:hypothetical protein [Rathayibacter sp. VKM Ac-2835]NRG40111.1 hypothetical protein [Rathayibacter sp. VKM Ac-2835]